MEKELKLKRILYYTTPLLLLISLIIPFICIHNSNHEYIYLSPLQILFEKNFGNVTNIIYILFTLSFVAVTFFKQNESVIKIKKILLVSSTLVYLILFKVTSNVNLNLLSVILNMIILIIYIVNYVKEFILTKTEE